MSAEKSSLQVNWPYNSQTSSDQDRPFIFDSIPSVAPIRFDPTTPIPPPTTSLRSQSSLSSSMTPEDITLQIKFTNKPSNNVASDNATDPQSSHLLSTVDTTKLVDVSQPPSSFPSGSSIGQKSIMDVSQGQMIVNGPYQAPSTGKKLPGKLTTRYVMPNGSVVTGKGLGRGRPGVKRGPRKSKLPGEESVESTPSAPTQTPTETATPVGVKRKRSDSETSNIRARSVSSSPSEISRESSVEYNPTATQTRSGRNTQKPVPIFATTETPPVNASPASRNVSTPVIATPVLKTHPKIKRKIYRGKEQFALCEHCLRGFGPVGNVIVFCDACNKCWHQRCHQPQISQEIVTDSTAEWFCATCDKILHGNKKSKKPPPKPEVQPAPPPEQKFGPPFVGAIALTIEQRKKYLENLSRDQLVNLLLRAGELAPQMPIFETPIPIPRSGPSLQPQFTSDYVTPVTITLGAGKPGAVEIPDEGYDDSYDEHAALYPKIGEGVKLPPERDDLNMLLEGPDSRTFSHWVKGQPVKTVVDTIPLHLSQTTK